jgi:hypothetical protein
VGDRSGAVTRRPPISLDTIVPRTEGYTYRLHVRRWGLGFVNIQGAILCRAVPNLKVTIRNFVIAVCVSACTRVLQFGFELDRDSLTRTL